MRKGRERLAVLVKLTLLHSERPKLYGVLAVLSAIGLNIIFEKRKGVFMITGTFIRTIMVSVGNGSVSLSTEWSLRKKAK